MKHFKTFTSVGNAVFTASARCGIVVDKAKNMVSDATKVDCQQCLQGHLSDLNEEAEVERLELDRVEQNVADLELEILEVENRLDELSDDEEPFEEIP